MKSAIALSLLLVACSPAGPSVSLSPADLAQLQQNCRAAQATLSAATAPAAPPAVNGTAIYPKAFCDQVLAGGVPATADAGSPRWLPAVLAAVQTTAQVAGYLLPAVLPLI